MYSMYGAGRRRFTGQVSSSGRRVFPSASSVDFLAHRKESRLEIVNNVTISIYRIISESRLKFAKPGYTRNREKRMRACDRAFPPARRNIDPGIPLGLSGSILSITSPKPPLLVAGPLCICTS